MPFPRSILALFAAAALGLSINACGHAPDLAAPQAPATPIPSLTPAHKGKPLIAIVTDNDGSETTDTVIPFAILSEWGGADVQIISTRGGPVSLMPALELATSPSLASYDAAHPQGADLVIIPALHHPDRPEIAAFLRRQAARGAILMSICEGAEVLARADLLKGHRATSHFYALPRLKRKFPQVGWLENRRYVFDGKVITTSGVSASLPASLALVAALSDPATARGLARRLGLPQPSDRHRSTAFAIGPKGYATAAVNLAAFWGHERFAIPLSPGFDELALALQADSWSRTYRSQVTATAAGPSQTSRHGLTFATQAGNGTLTPLPLAQGPAPQVLQQSLGLIAGRYGPATADFVRTQLELPLP